MIDRLARLPFTEIQVVLVAEKLGQVEKLGDEFLDIRGRLHRRQQPRLDAKKKQKTMGERKDRKKEGKMRDGVSL